MVVPGQGGGTSQAHHLVAEMAEIMLQSIALVSAVELGESVATPTQSDHYATLSDVTATLLWACVTTAEYPTWGRVFNHL